MPGMDKYSTAVIGGGAAGICAAISTARRGESVVICEKMPQLGKKILASGNGRCNLLNEDMSEAHYNPAARKLIISVFEQFGKTQILDFFKRLGLETYSVEGRIFPVTNQASSVLKVLEMELKRLSVPVEFNFHCTGVSSVKNGILVSSQAGRKIECRKLIITGGGKTYPAFGSDGGMYRMAAQIGHTIVEPVPVAVPLIVKDPLCHLLQGQKIFAAARSIIEDKTGRAVRGDLLFTRYGLSGTCILDVSEAISIAVNRYRKAKVFVSVDMVPFMETDALRNELNRRKKAKWSGEEMLTGILPNKLALALRGLFESNNINTAVDILKDRRFIVAGTRGWNEAEFTGGGINVNEINPVTLESKLKKGIHFAGEVLDINGQRGGYNLGWAWASGFVAGK